MLATDGLTEVRNRAGAQLLGAAARWSLIERASPHAQQLADELVAAGRARAAASRLRDDLAILAIRVVDAEPARCVEVALALMLLWLAAFAPAARRLQSCIAANTSCSTARPTIRRCSIWDSRARLREYHAASFDEAQAMLPHALLVAPGTRATVVSCVPNFVESPIFHSPDDAIGVVISTGPQRGITRWVLGSDVRPLHPKLVSTLGSCPAKTRSRPSGESNALHRDAVGALQKRRRRGARSGVAMREQRPVGRATRSGRHRRPPR